MNYADLFTPHHIALLADWLAEKGELCVDIYHPHGGGGPTYFTVRSLAELKKVISGTSAYLELIIAIWKNNTQVEFESDTPPSFQDDLKWIYDHNDEVMYFSIQKNRNWSQCYHDNPSKYQKEVEDWSR